MPGGANTLGRDEAISSMPKSFRLDGKVAVVLGAGGGLGQAIAFALASAGADIVAIGKTPEPLNQTCQGIRKDGQQAWAYSADLAEPQNIEKAMSWAHVQRGRLDILVNAAGVQLRKPALEVTEEEWDRMVSVNLKGVFFCCQAAARIMARYGTGTIITLTSLTAVIGLSSLSVYGACKGGVAQLMKALAVEWAPIGIRVNAIGPGRIRTPMTEVVFQKDSIRESFLRLIPLGRAGNPNDLVGAAIFLASEASSYITGQTLYIDGGWLASGGNPLA